MQNQLLLTADLNNVNDCVDLALEHGFGIEIMCFAYPDVLDGDWQGRIEAYRRILEPVSGPITMHGPFLDMVSGSPDSRINQVCIDRYHHALRIAAELGIQRVIFHANFIGSLHNTFYREGWHMRNVAFWGPMAEYARKLGITVALENMWEFDPTIITDLLEAVNHPNLRACLDVGHAHLFSDKTFTFDYWLRVLGPWLAELHINNNNGIVDEHHGLNWEHGVLDYREILPKLYALESQPDITMEMWKVDAMRDSVSFFELKQPAESPPRQS